MKGRSVAWYICTTTDSLSDNRKSLSLSILPRDQYSLTIMPGNPNDLVEKFQFEDARKEKRQRHVAFVPFLAHGHMLPMLVLCKSFARRGFKCTIISTPYNISKLRNSSLSRDGDDVIEYAELHMPCMEGHLAGKENASQFTSHPELFSFFEAMWMLNDPLKTVLEQVSPDFVVSDKCMPLASCDLGIPTAAWYYGSALSLMRLWYFANKDNNMPEIIHDIHIGDVWEIDAYNLRECLGRCRAFLINTSEALEANLISDIEGYMKKPMIPIGPPLLHPQAVQEHSNSDKWVVCKKWLDLQLPSSVLYIAFGSMCAISNAQAEQIAIGLDRSEVPFLWVLAEQDDPERNRLPEGFEERVETEKRGMILKGWVPQMQILAHSSVGGFMSHCGWNSVQEGLFHGLPIVAIPMQFEQATNARVVTRIVKAALEVEKGENGLYGNDNICFTVKRVMVEEEGALVRKNAANIGNNFTTQVLCPGGAQDQNIDRLVNLILEKAVPDQKIDSLLDIVLEKA